MFSRRRHRVRVRERERERERERWALGPTGGNRQPFVSWCLGGSTTLFDLPQRHEDTKNAWNPTGTPGNLLGVPPSGGLPPAPPRRATQPRCGWGNMPDRPDHWTHTPPHPNPLTLRGSRPPASKPRKRGEGTKFDDAIQRMTGLSPQAGRGNKFMPPHPNPLPASGAREQMRLATPSPHEMGRGLG